MTSRGAIWRYIRALQASEGTTIFMTTHYMDEAERCTQVAYIYEGNLLVCGEPNSLKQQEIAYTHRRVEIICQPLMPALAVLRGAPHVDDVSVFGQALHIRVKDLGVEVAAADSFASFAAAARRALVMEALRTWLVERDIERDRKRRRPGRSASRPREP